MHLDGGDEVSIVPFVYPRGTVSVSSLGYFSSVGSSSKPSHPSLTPSLGACHIPEHFKKKRGRKRRLIKPQQEKARYEEWMKQGKVYQSKCTVPSTSSLSSSYLSVLYTVLCYTFFNLSGLPPIQSSSTELRHALLRQD